MALYAFGLGPTHAVNISAYRFLREGDLSPGLAAVLHHKGCLPRSTKCGTCLMDHQAYVPNSLDGSRSRLSASPLQPYWLVAKDVLAFFLPPACQGLVFRKSACGLSPQGRPLEDSPQLASMHRKHLSRLIYDWAN